MSFKAGNHANVDIRTTLSSVRGGIEKATIIPGGPERPLCPLTLFPGDPLSPFSPGKPERHRGISQVNANLQSKNQNASVRNATSKPNHVDSTC